MNFKKLLSVLLLVNFSLLMVSCSSVNTERNGDDSKEIISNGKYLPKQISQLTLKNINFFSAQFPLKVITDESLGDFAEASRFYSEKSFEKTDKCVIRINFSFHYDVSFLERDPSLFKNFIYLHELAHCDDTEDVPKGIDSREWLESLADGYSMETLYQNKLVDFYKMKRYRNFREVYGNKGAAKMIDYLIEHKIGENQTWDEYQTMEKIKEIRRNIFNLKST